MQLKLKFIFQLTNYYDSKRATRSYFACKLYSIKLALDNRLGIYTINLSSTDA